MKTPFSLSVMTFLLALASSRCFALIGIEEVNKERAKELGLEIRATAAGPDAVWVALEFATKGELKNFVRVDLELGEGGKLLLSSTLKEEQPKPGHVVVSFSVDRAQLDKITLRVVTGMPIDYTGHDLRMKDFIDVKKLASQEEEARFLAAVRKAFDARDASILDTLTCWDRMPEKAKRNLQGSYAALVAQKGVAYDFKLVEPELKFIDVDRKEDGATYRANLPITRQLNMKGIDTRDDKTLFLLCFAVGEKDGKLFLAGSAPVK